MINELEIQNFKSIKDLKLSTSRVNIFIGKPNTGKSNLLEALGMLSVPYNYISVVRLTTMDNLFYDNEIKETVLIRVNDYKLTFTFKDGFRQTTIIDNIANIDAPMTSNNLNLNNSIFQFKIKYYKFLDGANINTASPGELSHPRGDNLYSILETNNEVYEYADDLLKSYGYDLVLRQATREMEFVKRSGRKLITFPYSLIADTLRRMIFYHTAIITNNNATLVFEEPESFAFPYYTKELAQTIAYDENNNQYFITTHNPYFLKTVVDKTPSEQIKVFNVYYEDYKTKVKEFDRDTLIELFLEKDIDVFLNIDKLLEVE